MEKKASPVWLIIFLCAIIIGMVFMVTKFKHQMTVNLLNQEIQKLTQEIEQAEKEKETLKEKLPSSPISSADLKQSSPSSTTATNSAFLESKTATASKKR